jgi:hypothetical protein
LSRFGQIIDTGIRVETLTTKEELEMFIQDKVQLREAEYKDLADKLVGAYRVG